MVQLYYMAEDTTQAEVTKKLTGQVAMLTEQVEKLAELVATFARQVPLMAYERATDESQGTNLAGLIEQLDTQLLEEPSSTEEELEQVATTSEHTFTTAPKESDDQGQPEQISEHTGADQTGDCVGIKSSGHVEQFATAAELDSTRSHEEHEGTAQAATLVEDVSNNTHGESEDMCQPELEPDESTEIIPPEYYKEPNDMDQIEGATPSEQAPATIEDVSSHTGQPERVAESIKVVSTENFGESQSTGQVERAIEREQPEENLLVADAAPKQANLPASEDGSTAPSELIQPSPPEEDVIAEHRGKLFRFEGYPLKWKALGSHVICLLQHKETKNLRVLVTPDNAAGISVNYRVTKATRLQPNISSNRSWVWSAIPVASNEENSSETVAFRFANKEVADGFKAIFEAVQASIPDEAQTPEIQGEGGRLRAEESQSQAPTT